MFLQNVGNPEDYKIPEDHNHNFELRTNIILAFQTGNVTADFEF
jgi:hypothetical protein